MSKEEIDRYKTLVSNLENELKSKGRFLFFLTAYLKRFPLNKHFKYFILKAKFSKISLL